MPKTQRFVTPYKKQTTWIRALGLLLQNNIVRRNLANDCYGSQKCLITVKKNELGYILKLVKNERIKLN
ncbi:hypothetical protein D2C73_04590 [Helicobacter pylori]|nr:hypothetical protein D2C73_04590 [Helicobacter pylori]